MDSLTNAQIRAFKARAQHLKATLKIGKEGLSPRFIAALDEALKRLELVKVKFDDFKEQKKELAPQLAEKPAAISSPGLAMSSCSFVRSRRSRRRSNNREGGLR